jgi:para-nitrobenzyl esterase
MIRSALVAALVAASVGTGASRVDAVKVTIDTGVLVGESKDGVESFRGIPFAKPPIGQLRWQPPQMVDKWNGDRDATQFKLPSPQPNNPDGKTPNGGGVSGATSEDCLYVNVHAPASAKNAPVMVWLYGGASYLGGGHLGSYNAPSFAKNGVIVVTANYRLGPLGGSRIRL